MTDKNRHRNWGVADVFYEAKQKKVSASTNMAQIFTGGRSGFFFCWKFFTRKSGMPTSTFHEQGTVKNVVARVEQAARVCWTVGHVHVRRPTRNELEYAVSSFLNLRLELRLIAFDDDVKKDMEPVFSCFVRSLELQCEACKSSFYLS